MLKVLLKKQMTEVFRGFFYNRKTNKARSKANQIVLFSLFAFLMVGVLGGSFTAVALGVCFGLTSAGMGWLYFVLMSSIAVVLGAFGSVFNTYSGLYLPKDNDLLLSMPIPVRTIIVSRLLNVYLLGAMYSGVVMLPTMIVYWVIVGAAIQNVICGIVLFLIITIIVLILSCLLGWIVAKISLKLKNKSFIVVLIALACIGGYYFIYFKAQIWIRELVANASVYGTNVKDSAYGLYLFGRIGEGDLIATAIFAAATALLLALTIFILSRGFLKLATSTASVGKVKYHEKAVKEKSVFGALLAKEFMRFKSSPNYMLNCGFGVLLLPVLGVFLLIKGADILAFLGASFGGRTDFAALLLCTVLMLLSTANDMAAPAVSLEGKSLWIPQSMPVDAKTVLKAKTAMQLILTLIPMLFAVICAAIVLQAPIAEKLLVCVLPLIFAVFSAMLASYMGVMRPVMEWTTEIIPIKQSGAVVIAVFGGWGFVALFALPYLLIGQIIGLVPYLMIWAVIYTAASALLYRRLITKGSKAFSRL
ncbi:hypothetical protein [Lachnoclostridium sp. MSJ-17]|uniref:hypothetical protein n=1 Tax=Lachnoclostridium sp. MSJ-17 TaxID=2841516 RepID=UPI001C100315|nr:hypothetical protein [Lachnoclostridium sp. MSJ-17]MBU5462442.1 hypothetical protein [Lachnoclostridium sp. MSJ-17]